MLSRLKRRIKVGRSIALKASSEIYIPVSFGIFSHTIILPDGVIDGGSSDELEMILTHELAHIKRRDYLINFLQNMLKAFFFFHPLFHLMNRNLTREREHICDDWVINMTQQRSGYAECIIGLLEKALYQPLNVPVTIAMAERKRDIPRRIDMIMDKRRKVTAKVSKKALIAMSLVGCLALPIIGGIEFVRAGVRPNSNEGRIVFERSSYIWVMDVDGKNEKQITTGRTPAWSPDGKQIAFSRRTGGRPLYGYDMYIMNADGSNMKQLTGGPENDSWPAWSPDGKQIAFIRQVLSQFAIYVMDADGSNVKSLEEVPLAVFLSKPRWSTDGTKIAYCSDKGIWVMDANGENPKELYQGLRDGPEGIDWSPVGDKIVFCSWKDSAVFRSDDIYVMNADGTDVKRLTQPGPARYTTPVWSPDGTKIVFLFDPNNGWDVNWEIYVMDADGLNVQRLTNTPQNEMGLDWTAFSYAVEFAGKRKWLKSRCQNSVDDRLQNRQLTWGISVKKWQSCLSNPTKIYA